MIGVEDAPEWLETRGILGVFGTAEYEAVAHYVRFIAEGKGQPSPWDQLKHQVFLGSDAFVESMRRKVPAGRDLREVPQAKARPPAKSLAHYARKHSTAHYARKHSTRNEAITAAYASGGYTMLDIGDHFGLHYSRISQIVQAAGQAKKAKGKT